MNWARKIGNLLSDPPPEFVFEISEAGIAWARCLHVETGFAPLEPGVLSISPLADNLTKPAVFQAEVARMAAANGNGRNKTKGVVLVLPDYCARVAVLDFDAFPSQPDEQVSLIRFRMKKSVAFDVDAAAISHFAQPHMSGEKKLDVVVALVALETLARYEAPFRAVGLQPGLVTTSTLAALDLASHSAGEEFPKAASVLVKLAGKVLTVSVLVKGALKLLRCLELEDLEIDALTGILFPTLAYMEDELKMKPGVMLGCGLGRLQMPLEFLCSQELGVPLQPLRSRFGAVTAQNAGMLGYLESRGKA